MSSVSGKRVFVVAEDAGRGEAQFFLLHLLRHLDAEGADVDLFVWSGGGLLDEYAKVARVRDLDDLNRWLVARFCERLRLRRVGQALKGLRLRWWLRGTTGADVGYLSGAEAARICGFLPADGPPLVTHLHGTRGLQDLAPGDRAVVLDRTGRFVASSEEAHDDLVTGHDVPAERVQRQDYLLLVDALALSSDDPPTRAGLGIPDEAVVVAGAGTPDWWATPDPFVLMAWDVARRVDGVDPWFLWIGPDSGERELWPLRHDLRNAGIEDRSR
ncbi:MAG: glycosyltransferase, partial [Actinomycetota bacterium]